MHACERLLRELMLCIGEEKAALAQEDVDMLEQLAQRRKELLQSVWDARAGFDATQLRLRLQEVQKAQEMLTAQAEALQQKLRGQFAAGRKQAKYFDGDRHIQSQLQKAFYCDSVS